MIDETSGADVPGEEREGLTLDRYAEVMANVRHFPRSSGPEVLARLGLTGQRWESAVLAWTAALAEESAMEKEALSIRFGTMFAKTRARLKEEQPTLPSLGLLPEKKAAVAAPAPVSIETAPPIVPEPVAPQVELPSYMLSPSPPTPAPPAPAFAPFFAPASLIPQRQAVVPARHADLRATADSSDLPVRPAIPFNLERTPEQALADVIARMTAAQGAPPTEGGNPPHARLGETVGVAAFPVGRALPFSNNAPSPAAPSWMPPGMLKLVSVEGTQLSTDAPAGPVLPFESGKSSRIALEDALAQAARLQVPAPRPTKGPGLAGTMEPGNALDLRKPELPFSAPSAPIAAQAPTLSIERYASLCVELTAAPVSSAQTRRRYQLTEPEWLTLDAHWKARLSREPEVRAAWESACAAYRAWLAQIVSTKR